MENYVNLIGLQDHLENLLFSVRYINSDHQETALTVDDYESFELKAKQTFNELESILNLNSPPNESIQNLYEVNHIKEARLKIFNTVLNVILNHRKETKVDFSENDLKAIQEITNDSMKMLYKVNL